MQVCIYSKPGAESQNYRNFVQDFRYGLGLSRDWEKKIPNEIMSLAKLHPMVVTQERQAQNIQR